LTRREGVLVRQWGVVRHVLARRRCHVARLPRAGSRSTLYRDVRVLVRAGILVPDGRGVVRAGVLT
jgi:hypothetical protein